RRGLRTLRSRAPGRAQPEANGRAWADRVRAGAVRPRGQRQRLDRAYWRTRRIGRLTALAQHGSWRPRPPDPLHESVHRTDHAAFSIARCDHYYPVVLEVIYLQ